MSSLLVEICKVDSIVKHPNADKLSVIGVKGWNCIVGLDQYKEDDLVVFVPPDSIIPPNLIEKYNLTYLKKDGKVGTTRLRGFLSQGLILDLPEGKWKIGDDVASTLGIIKWEASAPPVMKGVKQTSKKKINPFFDKYTDIENIKNYNDIFKPEDMVIITEKIHGSNARYANLEIVINKNQPLLYKIQKWIEKYVLGRTHEFVYGSHNVQITGHAGRKSFYGDDIWGKIAEKYGLANIIPKDYILYGEIYGKGIQDLTYGLDSVDICIFDMKYQNKYLSWDAVEWFCNEHELKTVPVLYIGNYSDDLIETFTKGESYLCKGQMREGCVIKTYFDKNDPKIGRKILKSINSDYLLRKNGTEYQ